MLYLFDCSLLDKLEAWMSGGGVIIIGACLASLATVIVLLAVALCVVRTKRRRRPAPAHLTMTKVELQPISPSQSGEITACHPLLDADKLSSDVPLRQLDNEPVRYVVSQLVYIDSSK
jgi:hypothetical protein